MKKIIKLLAIAIIATLSFVTLPVNAAKNSPTKENSKQQIFVSPHWVNRVLHNKTNIKDYKILEASYGDASTFKKGHIPNSKHINTNTIESSTNQWNLLSAKHIKRVLLKHGITSKTTLIVYSKDINAASRMAFAALWTGVNNIKVIDGGYTAWKKSNFKIQKGKEKPSRTAKNLALKFQQMLNMKLSHQTKF